MKGSMDDYIDEIRGYDHKLQAIGYCVDDDDLVSYALKGLPEEYKPIRAALNAKGDTMFNDLATILKNEESQILRDEGLSAPKVFLTNQNGDGTRNSAANQGQLVGPMNTPVSDGGSASMYQNPNVSGPYFPVQNNRNFSAGQTSRGGRNSNSKMECQICGKTNHTALYCYHRQNLQYQPPPQFSRPNRGDNQPWNRGNQNWNGGNQNWNGGNQTWNGGNQNWNGRSGTATFVPFVSPFPGVQQQRPQQLQQSFALVTPPSQSPQPSHMIPYGGLYPSQTTHNHQMQGGSVMMPLSQATPQAYVTTTLPSSQGSQSFVSASPQMNAGFSVNGQMGQDAVGNCNWLFDSGASSHVTNDLAQLS
ncbi:hypothetical protein Vadar_027298 [Vaccinium darrowii]|uniref:Uncharacterized protein n=1 Tax=Vaccinium darrowii TaxID=229202 RepID=A0ACB7YZH8_9ERIC|nr:hypothetical protein Vadar_027298 [Vaccinium darrowii]